MVGVHPKSELGISPASPIQAEAEQASPRGATQAIPTGVVGMHRNLELEKKAREITLNAMHAAIVRRTHWILELDNPVIRTTHQTIELMDVNQTKID